VCVRERERDSPSQMSVEYVSLVKVHGSFHFMSKKKIHIFEKKSQK
jgi:hypothetical protein